MIKKKISRKYCSKKKSFKEKKRITNKKKK